MLQVNQKLMLDRVGEENVEEKDLISKHFPKITVEAPGYTPWSEKNIAILIDITYVKIWFWLKSVRFEFWLFL